MALASLYEWCTNEAMTSPEFLELLGRETDVALVAKCLGTDVVPYVFEPRPDTWNTFRDEVGEALGVSRDDINVVGSGRFGLSLKPGKNLKRFSDDSDIDVVVINSTLFDEFWLALLDAAYPREPLTEMVGGWLQKRRNEVYTGWLTPLQISIDHRIFGRRASQVLTLKARWFNALKTASRHPPRRHSDVRGRLYRTTRHAELYHLSSLAALRRSLSESL
jgi:hypothetical protein